VGSVAETMLSSRYAVTSDGENQKSRICENIKKARVESQKARVSKTIFTAFKKRISVNQGGLEE
jgi:hypothetical protein